MTRVGVAVPTDWQGVPAIIETQTGYQCQRCGNTAHFYPNECLGALDCVYCFDCLAFGVLRRCDQLYECPAPSVNSWMRSNSYLTFDGTLSTAQQEVSDTLVAAFQAHQDHLVWAVTGAGKTEMLFQVVDTALCQGQRVAIATPRIDVANELVLRFAGAFPEIDTLLLHGKSAQTYRYTPLVICSTHQLVRFHQAFDLLVIDETDAFPFNGDPMPERAARTALRTESTLVYLTATPDRKLRRQVKQGKLTQSFVSAGYHRQPLPVPKHRFDFGWEKALERGRIPKRLYIEMQRLLQAERRFLVFLPTVKRMVQLEKIVRNVFPNAHFEAVHASENERLGKVQAMHDTAVQFLLTITILERGAPFEAIDVIVLGSEHRAFITSALVQIAGRVGRPNGEVIFIHAGRTKASVGAVREIQRMNRLGRLRGLLDEADAMNCLLCGEIIIPKITLRELCFWTVPMNQPICEECLKSITPITGAQCPQCARPQETVTLCSDCEQWRTRYDWQIAHHAFYHYQSGYREWLLLLKGQREQRLAGLFKKELLNIKTQYPITSGCRCLRRKRAPNSAVSIRRV